ncbi:DUF922 domain-containing protein [Geopseudomonas aromaticivorans]
MGRLPVRALTLMLASGAAQASVEAITTVREQHYPVHGQAIHEIQASMRSNTPIRKDGNPYGAVAAGNYSAVYDLRPLPGGGCAVANVQVRIDLVVTLPQLMPGARSAAVEAEWQRYYAALRAHEYEHVKNGEVSARAVQRWLSEVKTSMSCTEAKPRVGAAVQAVFTKLDERDKEMDRVTRHGATQGADLDPRVR